MTCRKRFPGVCRAAPLADRSLVKSCPPADTSQVGILLRVGEHLMLLVIAGIMFALAPLTYSLIAVDI
jgi:hypothetical protein